MWAGESNNTIHTMEELYSLENHIHSGLRFVTTIPCDFGSFDGSFSFLSEKALFRNGRSEEKENAVEEEDEECFELAEI